MEFEWHKEQTELRDSVYLFAENELNSGLSERDKSGEFNHKGWLQCADIGIQGLCIDEQYNGTGYDMLTAVGVLESFGKGCRDNGLWFSIGAHMWTVQMPLVHFGSDDQKDKYLPKLVSGELIGGNAMTEPDSGSDAYSLKTHALRQGDHYLLNGNKTFVTNGPIADVVVVYATTDPKMGKDAISAFIVHTDWPGVTVSKPLEKMGIHTSPMAELHFEDCRVPLENLLGREGAGQALFTDSMTWERTCILAPAVGAMERVFAETLEYANSRKQFGEPIAQFQLVGAKLVDMKLRVDAARDRLYRAAWKHVSGRSIFLEAALAKISISENWVAVTQDALQILGGYGYMKEFGIEQQVRDAFGSKIYSGTSEIQRTIAASLLKLG